MMLTQKALLPTAIVALSLALTACETADQNSIQTAQTCLNNAASVAINNSALGAQQAYGCEATIANMTSPQAAQIGVGLVLVEEQKLANMTSVENAISAGTNAVATSISYLTFSSVGQVNKLVNYANISGSNGTMELANIINFAQYVNAQAGGTISSTTTPTQVAGYINNLVSTAPASVVSSAASAALLARQSACSGGSTNNSTICTDLTKAINGATTASAILTNIANYISTGG